MCVLPDVTRSEGARRHAVILVVAWFLATFHAEFVGEFAIVPSVPC